MPSFSRQCGQSRAQRVRAHVGALPRGLEGHAELAAGDLFLQGLDVGVLFEKEIGDPRDDPGLVAPDDGDGGKFSHEIHE
jgi:hypothetical protein